MDYEKEIYKINPTTHTSQENLANSPILEVKYPSSTDKTINLSTYEDRELDSFYPNNRQIAMEKLERLIIQTQLKCPDDIIDYLKVKAFQTDFNELQKMLKTSFDQNFHKKTGCLVDALISQNRPFPDYRLRRWLKSIYKINNDLKNKKSQADFFLSGVSYCSIFVIKTNSETLTHEAIVGMGALNNLRDKVPNFIYVYGAFMCHPPILDAQDNLKVWCPEYITSEYNQNVTYLILENFQDSFKLEQIIDDLDSDEFLEIYLQILNALYIAHKKYDFTHYNLDLSNVLVTKFDKYLSIPFYHYNDFGKYIRTKFLVKIINYEFSHVKIQGQNFGRFGYEDSFKIFPENSYPMHDAYKLILSSYSALNDTSKLGSVLEQIYSFFGEKMTLKERLEKTNIFKPLINLRHLQHQDLIDYILTKFSVSHIITNDINDTILTICESNCLDWNRFDRMIFNKRKLPETIEDYCQALIATEKLKQDERVGIREWLKNFNFVEAYKVESQIFQQRFNSVLLEIDKINSLNIEDFLMFKKLVYKLIKIKHEIIDIIFWIKSVEYSLRFNLKAPVTIKEELKSFEYVYNLKEVLIKNKKLIQNKLKDSEFLNKVKSDSQLLSNVIVVLKGIEDIDVKL